MRGSFYPFNAFASIAVVLYHEYLEQTREKNVFFSGNGFIKTAVFILEDVLDDLDV